MLLFEVQKMRRVLFAALLLASLWCYSAVAADSHRSELALVVSQVSRAGRVTIT